MHRFLFDSRHRLRNGWWILAFVFFFLLTRLVHGPASRGLRELGLADRWLDPLPVLLAILATWACTRLRREPLTSVGLRFDRRWLSGLGWGTAIGGVQMLVIAAAIGSVGGVRFELDPVRSGAALLAGLWMFLWLALLEEVLFRGFLFQRLVAGTGVWVAQIGLAALFAVAHWGNPGMTGATEVWATLDIGLGAVLYGLAYLRTGSLALPVGLHLGWNWVQGSLLGFGVSGYDFAGWLRPVPGDRAQWITGGAFGPEASVFAVVVDLALLVALWRWRGRDGGSVLGDARAPSPGIATYDTATSP